MPTEDKTPGSQPKQTARRARFRLQTDESLRVERENADEVLAALAAARAKTDRQSEIPAPSARSRIGRERALEGQTLREERARADETVRKELAEQVALLSIEREKTDKGLCSERVRSDDALATRDEFLGIVSHDLRNMLGAMVGFAGLIAEAESRENHAEQVLMHVKRIQCSGARMNCLIGDLLDVASIQAGMLAVTRVVGDPTQVVTEAVDTFQAQASASVVSLVTEIVPPSSLTAFDSVRILQVLTNLLSNAIKFTPADGKVVVRVERIRDEIRFAISDTGVGIPTDELEAVFERFVQVTKNDQRGVGLGLYISKCIVQGHGGRIWAENRIGEGSTFYFTLPVHVAA